MSPPINHDPAFTFFGTGHQQPAADDGGGPVRLGNENQNCPRMSCSIQARGSPAVGYGAGFLPAQQARAIRSEATRCSFSIRRHGQTRASSLTENSSTGSRRKIGIQPFQRRSKIKSWRIACRQRSSSWISRKSQRSPDFYGRRLAVLTQQRLLATLGRTRVALSSSSIAAGHHGAYRGFERQIKETDQSTAGLSWISRTRTVAGHVVIWGRSPTRQSGDIKPDNFGRTTSVCSRCGSGRRESGYVHGETTTLLNTVGIRFT